MINLEKTNTYYLEPKHENVKSYYKKATVKMVTVGEKRYKQLISYSTIVAQTDMDNREAKIFGTYSMTTLRHIKEFLNQEGYEVGTKAQLEKMYLV